MRRRRRSRRATLPGLTCCIALLVAACNADPQPGPLDRPTAEGLVRGEVSENGANRWLGIPFAAPPVGELRWQRPQSPAAWSGIREPFDAPDCAQLGNPFDRNSGGGPVGSEDCLYLDIYAPAGSAEAVLPVMMWVHGGGNTFGGPGDLTMNRLVPDHEVVLVAVRYRLGPFGWFSHEALRAGGEDAASFALLDLIAALQWTRDNIGAFGGDAGNVTVVGESAGGRNTVALLLSPLANGLFQRAIVQSGAVTTTPRALAENRIDADEPGHGNSSGEVFLRLMVAEGAATDRAAAIELASTLSPDAQRVMLRAASTEKLLRALTSQNRLVHVPDAIRDGIVVPFDDPRDIIAGGRHNAMPVIMGSNRYETKLYMIFDEDFVTFGTDGRPVINDPGRYERIAYYGSTSWKLSAVDEPLSLLGRHQAEPVYAYRFDYDDLPQPRGVDLPLLSGAAHALEIPFIFGQFEKREFPEYYFDDTNEKSRWQLSRAMTAYWAEFAHTGNPDDGRDGDLPLWRAWTDNTLLDNLMVLDAGDGAVPRMRALRLTDAMLLEELATDSSLPRKADKCAAVNSMLTFRSWSGDELQKAMREYCAKN